jgi:hypothetical protein
MAGSPDIFKKARLRPSQIRTVAERRFADAVCLRKSNENERANGAIYLGGLVIECLLKAHLMEVSPWLQSAGSADAGPVAERYRWSLCYRSHDLDEILAELPDITLKLSRLDQRGRPRLVQSLRSICANWTIFARYSPKMATMAEARHFLDRVEELKPWLR